MVKSCQSFPIYRDLNITSVTLFTNGIQREQFYKPESCLATQKKPSDLRDSYPFEKSRYKQNDVNSTWPMLFVAQITVAMCYYSMNAFSHF